MKLNRLLIFLTIAPLFVMITACGSGDDFSWTCSPAPQINSSPPTQVTVGQIYRYSVDAIHECGLLPFVCSDVNILEMPPGAIFDGSHTITWTPSASQANTIVPFRIATVPDYCGDSTKQLWAVNVLPDTTPPEVTLVYPGDGANNIPVTTEISISFNEPVNPQTVTTSSFLISGPGGSIPGSSQISGSYVRFTPNGYLPYSSTITVTITTAVQDLSGNELASDYTWTFTTSEAPDTTAPTIPTKLTSTRVSGSEVNLSWDPSADDVAVDGYKIYRDGVNIQSVHSNSMRDTGLNFNTNYCYTILAYDHSGNESAQSDPLCVTTLDFLQGDVATWGYMLNYDGTSNARTIPDLVPELSNVISIADGLAVKSDGSVWQLGAVPTQVPNLTSVTAIAKGFNHSLAITSDGTVWAWGDNTYGQLGNDTTNSTTIPVQMQDLNQIVAVAGGLAHSLALKSDGTVWATGANFWGQLGDGTTTWQTVPIQVPSLSNVIAIAASWNQSVALKSDGTVWIWGGITSSYLSTPTQVSGLSNVVAISQGGDFSLAVEVDGTLWAWGLNGSGQLGDGTTTRREIPVQVTGLTNVTAVSAGDYYSLAVDADGTVWAWGYNGYGQLGDGTTINENVPVQVLRLNYVKAIVAGQRTSTSLALR